MDMQHPAFGPIEYYDDKWEGRVRVPFFAAYDYPDSWPGWNREQLKEGLFDLFIQTMDWGYCSTGTRLSGWVSAMPPGRVSMTCEVLSPIEAWSALG